jgi:hypothetical protein
MMSSSLTLHRHVHALVLLTHFLIKRHAQHHSAIACSLMNPALGLQLLVVKRGPLLSDTL